MEKLPWFEPQITEIEIKMTEMPSNKIGCQHDWITDNIDADILGEKQPCVGCS
ncbi:hypothetical protein [Desulfocucumis palustris]|uniref:hypothetical protein n=1 Tax=Desulfocucumis palustris TaxID=1898651 RepID=UPI0013FD858D|nr:hypothetical protein [Desulfocucumis palustris]